MIINVYVFRANITIFSHLLLKMLLLLRFSGLKFNYVYVFRENHFTNTIIRCTVAIFKSVHFQGSGILTYLINKQ